MRDRFFYPLALLVIAAIVGFAIMLGERSEAPTPEEILKNGIALEGETLHRLIAGPGTRVQYTTDNSGEIIAVLSTNIPFEQAEKSAGVFMPVPPAYKEVFAEKRLKMTVMARRGAAKPLDEFDMAYFAFGGGQTQWNQKQLTPEFKKYTLYFTPRVNKGRPGIDYAGIWPGRAGHVQTLELKKISVVVVPK
ncbi:MAG: hypothetical protein V3U57_02175 [Robiginitomaculum sp.]